MIDVADPHESLSTRWKNLKSWKKSAGIWLRSFGLMASFSLSFLKMLLLSEKFWRCFSGFNNLLFATSYFWRIPWGWKLLFFFLDTRGANTLLILRFWHVLRRIRLNINNDKELFISLPLYFRSKGPLYTIPGCFLTPAWITTNGSFLQ